MDVGGSVQYHYQFSNKPLFASRLTKWPRQILGDDFFDRVVEVNLFRTGVTDEWLCSYLREFDHLEILHLGCNPITDASLAPSRR